MLKPKNSNGLYVIIIMIFLCGCVPETIVILKRNMPSIGDDGNNNIPSHVLLSALTSPFDANVGGFCFVKSNTQNFCWGDNLPVAENFSAKLTAPSGLYGKVIEKFVATQSTNCAIADGKVYCWGVGGAVGNGTANLSVIPVAVNTSGVLNGKTIKDIFVGYLRACALDTGNDLYCWGYGSSGGLGHGILADSYVPVAVSKAGVLNGLTIKSVAMGANYTCAIASDDFVYCWGMGGDGQLGDGSNTDSSVPVAAVIPGGLTAKSLTAGNTHTCAIASDDQVYCWGQGNFGQIGDGFSSNTNTPTAIDTTGVLNGKTIKSISANVKATCAIANDDQVYCWGVTGKQLNNTDIISDTPIMIDQSGVLNGLTVKSISMGVANFCVIASDDKVYCWGHGADGKLGNNSTSNSLVPVAVDTSGVLSGKIIKEVKLFAASTCARDSANELYCWGDNSAGQLGIDSLTDSSVPVAVLKKFQLIGKTFKSISGTSATPCAINSDDQLYCWGGSFMSGLPFYSNQLYPMPVYANSVSNAALTNITFQYGTPDGHMCAQTISGDYYCKADEYLKYFNFGVQFKKAYTFGQLSGTCYLGVNNLAYCTGSTLGNASVPSSNVPVPLDMSNVGVGETIKDMAFGEYHACLLASNDQVYCWGTNMAGGLGHGSMSDAIIPTAIDMSGVLNGKTIKSLSMSGYSTCVIASDNQGYCWGFNGFGNLGDGTLIDATSPVAINSTGVLNGKLLRNITLSTYNTCAIADDNLAYCWGANTYGNIGNGSLIDSSVPVAVDTSGVLNGKTMKGLLLSNNFICSIASDDNTYCWGANDKGQLGNGTFVDSSVAVAVSKSGVLNNKTIKNLKVSTDTSCVLASDDKVYCWGEGTNHNLGNNTTAPSNIPVEVLYAP